MPVAAPAAPRSFLFFPGSRPDMIPKALATGADLLCMDLEDAVAPPDKAAARETALGYLAGGGEGPMRCVRMNGLKSLDGLKDLAAIAAARPARGLLVMPKVDAAEEVRVVSAALDETGAGLGLVALIETLRALEDVMAISRASPRLTGLLFGAADFSAELGVKLEHEPLLFARSRLALAARAADLDLFDVPTLDVRNLDIVRADAMRAKGLGFTGKAILHPAHVPVVHEVFTPSADEVAQAVKIVAAFRASDTGLVVVDGKLVEKPVVRGMEKILARARAAGMSVPID